VCGLEEQARHYGDERGCFAKLNGEFVKRDDNALRYRFPEAPPAKHHWDHPDNLKEEAAL
jgi:hypothetical protein